ncbi:MAG: hypothetical protein IJM66_11400 [Muribaculaceae bacterium]|nr:hypothetical protein [Muribaculaceae bacterium]
MPENEKYIKLLLGDVENRLGRGMLSPKDFEYLNGVIKSELNESVSVSTLKRLWGYSKYFSSPSVSILSTLCRLVGYRDWADYQARRESGGKKPSAEVMCDKITVATDLEPGDRIRLTWEPQRVCDVVYHGDGDFEVLSSQNTGIKAGDWFSCSLIVSGEPLWLSNLRQYGKAPVAYVCGKQGGVRFELMHSS